VSRGQPSLVKVSCDKWWGGTAHEYSNLEYVRVPVEYRVNVAEYVIRIAMAASNEYVNTSIHIQHVGSWAAVWSASPGILCDTP